MKGDIYQLYDADNMEFGLIYSEDGRFTTSVMEKEFKKYFNGDIGQTVQFVKDNPNYMEDISADGFVEYLESLGYHAERVFVEEIFSN